MNVISRETFEGMGTDSKLDTLFDYVKNGYECSCRTEEQLKGLEKKVERKKVIDLAFAGFTGLGGGALAVLGLWFKGLFKP